MYSRNKQNWANKQKKREEKMKQKELREQVRKYENVIKQLIKKIHEQEKENEGCKTPKKKTKRDKPWNIIDSKNLDDFRNEFQSKLNISQDFYPKNLLSKVENSFSRRPNILQAQNPFECGDWIPQNEGPTLNPALPYDLVNTLSDQGVINALSLIYWLYNKSKTLKEANLNNVKIESGSEIDYPTISIINSYLNS